MHMLHLASTTEWRATAIYLEKNETNWITLKNMQ